eukprot:gene21871-27838_t
MDPRPAVKSLIRCWQELMLCVGYRLVEEADNRRPPPLAHHGKKLSNLDGSGSPGAAVASLQSSFSSQPADSLRQPFLGHTVLTMDTDASSSAEPQMVLTSASDLAAGLSTAIVLCAIK